MSWLLCLIAVVSLGHWVTAQTTCSWKLFPKTNIAGGIAKPASTLSACQSACLAAAGCVSFDWNPLTSGCWILYTQDGKKASADIDHYDYVCSSPPDPCSPNPCLNSGQCSADSSSAGYKCTCTSDFTGSKCETAATQDIMRYPNIMNCLKTNYKESPSDLYSIPYAIPWSVDLTSFTIKWPDTLWWKTLTEIKYSTVDNVAYIRLKITDKNGQVHLTQPITSSSYKVTGINSVSEIVVYLAPVDYRKNVTIDGFHIYYCLLDVIILCGGQASIFSAPGILQLVTIATLGILDFGQGGGVRFTSPPELPYCEADLRCLGVGTSQFKGVEFVRTSNIKSAIVKIWSNGFPVTVINNSGAVTDTFYFAYNTLTSKYSFSFAPGIRGDRIQVSLIPVQIQDWETFLTITVQGLSIFTG